MPAAIREPAPATAVRSPVDGPGTAPSVVHVVATASFAGTERYVCEVANGTARRGWRVTVVGGSPARMRAALEPDVAWLAGARPLEALRSLAVLGRQDVCHAHMTTGEAVALAGRGFHRAPVVSTRHFAARRGSTLAGRLAAPWIGRRLARELAVSRFVAERLERPPAAVVPNGVASSPLLWRPESRVVLVLQRLEPEKDTLTALRAWQASGLAEETWSLRIAGSGSERGRLERWAAEHAVPAVTFAGEVDDVQRELAGAGMLLAPGVRDSFGLAVAEAMVAGVPVVAAAAGGHLETIGLVSGASLFAPGDHAAAAAELRRLAGVETRAALSWAARELALERLTLETHVDALLVQYELAGSGA